MNADLPRKQTKAMWLFEPDRIQPHHLRHQDFILLAVNQPLGENSTNVRESLCRKPWHVQNTPSLSSPGITSRHSWRVAFTLCIRDQSQSNVSHEMLQEAVGPAAGSLQSRSSACREGKRYSVSQHLFTALHLGGWRSETSARPRPIKSKI